MYKLIVSNRFFDRIRNKSGRLLVFDHIVQHFDITHLASCPEMPWYIATYHIIQLLQNRCTLCALDIVVLFRLLLLLVA
jgi:hypothetical protein